MDTLKTDNNSGSALDEDIAAVLRKHNVLCCTMVAIDNGNKGEIRAMLHKFELAASPLHIFVNGYLFDNLRAVVGKLPSAEMLLDQTVIYPNKRPPADEMPH